MHRLLEGHRRVDGKVHLCNHLEKRLSCSPGHLTVPNLASFFSDAPTSPAVVTRGRLRQTAGQIQALPLPPISGALMEGAWGCETLGAKHNPACKKSVVTQLLNAGDSWFTVL